ncbi:AlkA N-terminal domain-containing protein [Catenulispora rubra]|uniref:AlkA N-terminal domain-containing protein n=1 Tax=Catenulispora rubra TaxID=280293 RepID=UPI0018923736|nr:AlkA N-terminal domain-containing protein [Catenulispora rubra]
MTTFSAVTTTGIYCRPGCGAKPLAENVRTFELAATAEAAGFRACLRCRPYRVAGPVAAHSPELVCRAVQLVIDGALDEGTEAGLAARLAVSARHLRRLFNDHLGATPDQLARSRRAHFARRLLDDTDLTVADIAFASGFGSLRQFNRDMRAVFRASPSELRNRRRKADRLAADGGLTVRLPFQRPFDWDAVLLFLAERMVPGVESIEDRTYRRTISLDGRPGMLEVLPGGEDHLLLRAHLPYWEGLIHVVERAARMVGADTDNFPALQHLSGDSVIGPLVKTRPGIRVPQAWGAFEAAVHAVTAQYISPAQARIQVGALVRDLGQPVPGLTHGLTHLFPSAEVVAAADPARLGRPECAKAVHALASDITDGTVILDGGVALPDLVDSLTAIDGIGDSVVQEIALRLGHHDAFPHANPLVREALRTLNAPADAATRWQPWRSVAAVQLITRGAELLDGPETRALVDGVQVSDPINT